MNWFILARQREQELFGQKEDLEKAVLPDIPVEVSENEAKMLPKNPNVLWAFWYIDKKTTEKTGEQINCKLHIVSAKKTRTIPYSFNVKNPASMCYYIEGLDSGTKYRLVMEIDGIKPIKSNKLKTPYRPEGKVYNLDKEFEKV